MNNEGKEKLINDIIQEIDKLNTLPNIEEENFKMGYRKAIYDTTYLYETLSKEIERLNHIIDKQDRDITALTKEKIMLKKMTKAEEKISNLLPDETDFIIVRREDYNRLFGSDKE